MKSLALIKRRPDISRAEFRDHYEDIHAPLAIATILDGTTRYIRSHLREVLYGEPGFDVVTAFWYADLNAALEVGKRLESPLGEAILKDELTFMDKPANRVLPVTEHPVAGDEASEAAFKAVALVAAPETESAEDFSTRYESEWLPRLQAAMRQPRWCLQHRSLAMGPEPPVFHVVTQIHADADAGLADWAAALAEQGARVVVSSVEECESPL